MSKADRASMAEPPRHRAFIALGSNIEPERYLHRAVARLKELGEVESVSSVYESPPVDGSDQPNYLNAAVCLLTTLTADQLCRESLPAIESHLDRVRNPADRYAARTIDLDLALYDDAILRIDHRVIPDPEIGERPFLAIPLAEVAGEMIVPGTNQSLQSFAAEHRSDQSLTRRPDLHL